MSIFEVDGREARWERTGLMRGRPMFVFAHGAGASMHSAFMQHVTDGLVAREICVLRFHFPYMEKAHRTGRRGGPGPKRRLLATWRAVLDRVRRMRGRGPVVIGGKSMGGRYASMLAASGDAPEARGLLYFGYPLHPPGRPDQLRSQHLVDVRVPQLFVQGDMDRLCRPALLTAALRPVTGARIFQVRGDHSLVRTRRDPFAGSELWLDEAAGFIREVTAHPA